LLQPPVKPPGQKKFLVIAAVGENSLHPEWISDGPDFDVVLLNYGGQKVSAEGPVIRIVECKGHKFHLIKDFIDAQPEFVNSYDYIWLPDDDLSITTKGVNAMFAIASRYDLQLSQPSVRGYYTQDFSVKQSNAEVRFTAMVEIMAPMFRRDALLRLQHTFKDNESGWGLDHVWPHLLGHPPRGVGVIDAVSVMHTRPVGQMYAHRFRVKPPRELEKVLWKHGLRRQCLGAMLRRTWLRIKGRVRPRPAKLAY